MIQEIVPEQTLGLEQRTGFPVSKWGGQAHSPAYMFWQGCVGSSIFKGVFWCGNFRLG